MVGCFFGEDLSIICVLWWERDFRLCFFGGNSKFGYYSEFGNGRGVWEEVLAITLKDPVGEAIIQRMLEVLVLCIVVKVVIKMRVIDGVYVDMSVDSGKGSVEEGVTLLDIHSMGRIEVL